jgi:hypothetical protein
MRLLLAVLFLSAAAHADEAVVRVFGEDLRADWARCPFTLMMAQRRANRTLDLELDGKLVLTDDGITRVEYSVRVAHGWLRVSVAPSMKSHSYSGWHAPDTYEDRHELQLDAPGLAASIHAPDLASPAVKIFESAVDECVGVRDASGRG